MVHFNPAIRDQLREWLDRRDEEAPDTDVVFPTRKGTPISTPYTAQMVKREAKKAGVAEADRVSPYTLRHTFAVDLLQATEQLDIIQKALAYADISTT